MTGIIAVHVLSAGLPLWEKILAVPGGILAFLAIWAILEWPGRKRPAYWRCTARHNHRTPAAARDCSAAQRG